MPGQVVPTDTTRVGKRQYTSDFLKSGTVLRDSCDRAEVDRRRRLDMTPVNLDRIQEAIDAGLIDPNQPITMKTLKEARIIKKVEDGVKLLARVRYQPDLNAEG